MNVGVAHSEVNPNTRVMNSRGIWLTYLLLTVVLHIVLLSIPFITVPLVWTLTNVIHNLVSYDDPLYRPRSQCSKAMSRVFHSIFSCSVKWFNYFIIQVVQFQSVECCSLSVGADTWNSLRRREFKFVLGIIGLMYFCCAGDVPVSTYGEGNSFWDARPRQSSSAHTLGTDGLRRPVHIFEEIPHNLSNCAVSVIQLVVRFNLWGRSYYDG